MKKRVIYLLLTIILFSGCAKKTASIISDDYHLKQGMEYYNKKKFKKASESFEEAIKYAETPESAAEAQYFLANSYFNQENYTEAIPSYEQYLNIYPHSQNADNATYKLAISYYRQMNKVDRDQSVTTNALEIFNILKDKHPEFYNKKKPNCLMLNHF